MTFHVGQKVECIDDEGQPVREGDTPVKKGAVYTLRDVFDFFGEEGVRLQEITNPRDRGYHSWRFRPIVEKKTDISIFTAMLNASKQGVDA